MQIEKSAYAFQLDGTPVTCEEFGHGHINHTLKITTDTGAEYAEQRAIYEFLRNLPLIIIMSVGCTALPYSLCKKLSEKRQAVANALKPVIAVFLLILCTSYLVSSGYNPFLYFRF